MDERLKRSPGRPKQIIGDDISNYSLQGKANLAEYADNAQPDSLSPVRRKRRQLVQVVLPDAPKIAGYHTTWIGGEGQNEPLVQRSFVQNGYTPVTWQEAAQHDPENWNLNTFSTEQDPNSVVTINEKRCYKVSLEDYQEIMEQVAHYDPLEYEQGQKENIENSRYSNKQGVGIIEIDDGLAFNGAPAKRPNFRGVMNTARPKG